MENEKNQDSSYITFIDCSTTDSSTCLITSSASINYSINTNYNINTNDWVFTDGTGGVYIDPYQELEETKQQQEKEEELRKENSCLQEAWNEYQLILKLLEENECDKFVEKRYGMNK